MITNSDKNEIIKWIFKINKEDNKNKIINYLDIQCIDKVVYKKIKQIINDGNTFALVYKFIKYKILDINEYDIYYKILNYMNYYDFETENNKYIKKITDILYTRKDFLCEIICASVRDSSDYACAKEVNVADNGIFLLQTYNMFDELLELYKNVNKKIKWKYEIPIYKDEEFNRIKIKHLDILDKYDQITYMCNLFDNQQYDIINQILSTKYKYSVLKTINSYYHNEISSNKINYDFSKDPMDINIKELVYIAFAINPLCNENIKYYQNNYHKYYNILMNVNLNILFKSHTIFINFLLLGGYGRDYNTELEIIKKFNLIENDSEKYRIGILEYKLNFNEINMKLFDEVIEYNKINKPIRDCVHIAQNNMEYMCQDIRYYKKAKQYMESDKWYSKNLNHIIDYLFKKYYHIKDIYDNKLCEDVARIILNFIFIF